MNVVNKFYMRGLYLILFLGMSMTSFGQLEDPVSVDEDDDPIFQTEIKGGFPRPDSCYELGHETTIEKLGFYFSIRLGKSFEDLNINCDLSIRITVGGNVKDIAVSSLSYEVETVGSNGLGRNWKSLNGGYNFPQNIVDLLENCRDEIITIPVKVEFVCFENGVENVLSMNEINDYLGTNYKDLSSVDLDSDFSYNFSLDFCCRSEQNNNVNLSTNNNPSYIDDFKVISNDNTYELFLDEIYYYKAIRIDIYDLTGRILSTSNLIVGNTENVIEIPKPISHSGIHIISIRSSDDIKSIKVFNK